ncbi:hypothetical protein AAFF_G00076520 [Aldrovandia affinis]|uniref:Beta-1,4-N-acetylgalactosaminyltransferase n=1 Tax=Aldrovandia affinis TaxID=143900 RepID=A0AAD7RXP5_9TELE|nr:hypothetical protein AAFF_G00076520 [Aldrovandia affinis]
MRTYLFPLKKLRRNLKYLIFAAVLMTGVLAAYLEFVATTTNTWNEDIQFSPWNDVNPAYRHEAERESLSDSERAQGKNRPWESEFKPQPWRPEYKGQANLHIFEDWCGSSTAQLRRNLHYPLYPHARTTVKKLAVSPRWTNYGLRIFGYLHPHTDGEYLFAVASDDNSEFWLSLDDSPLNVRLLALVGKMGTEWTAPGEFEKYASQISLPVRLMTSKRYYFEIIHKQNDLGTDHVEVAWQLYPGGLQFTIIGSKHISLYTNESALMMSEVSHVPRSAASHVRPASKSVGSGGGHTADILRKDPRDSLHQLPLVDETYLRAVLPDCSYQPSYIIKGFPLLRYQGLQFVRMSYIYPNDYTRLTHMETDNKCFYHANPQYINRHGFYRYMRMDPPEDGRIPWDKRDFQVLEDDDIQYEDPPGDDPEDDWAEGRAPERSNDMQDYGDDYDDYAFKRKRKLFSMPLADGPAPAMKRKRRAKVSFQEEVPAQPPDTNQKDDPEVKVQRRKKSRKKIQSNPNRASDPLPLEPHPLGKNASGLEGARKERRAVPVQAPGRITNETARHLVAGGAKANVTDLEKPSVIKNRTLHRNASRRAPLPVAKLQEAPQAPLVLPKGRPRLVPRANVTAPQSKNEVQNDTAKRGRISLNRREDFKGNEVVERANPELDNAIHHVLDPPPAQRAHGEDIGEEGMELGTPNQTPNIGELWGLDGDAEEDNEDDLKYESIEQTAFDPEVNWEQTFDVDTMDFHSMRSDWIDLSCNVSGNLLLKSTDALVVVNNFMKKLNQRNPGHFSLLRVVNVEMRSDGAQGSRYLLELELLEKGGARVRLSRYVYVLQRRSRPRALGRAQSRSETLLCNPVGLAWNPTATVHFIVPVKNQARWVKQFIVDMEKLYKTTKDKNFNIIITDYSSVDMDVEQELRTSALPRYQYVRLNGNFERSAGLQAGIDLITEDHSIVFLCDLHIHFPSFIIDNIRKHCVEGKMAFAPIVMRLDCGATPQEPKGFWEVNGFGLLGIYKSDLDAAGGMNTKDFRDRWGGEDWELLDRILQAGLEVERIYLRNFMHHYHSKRGMWNRQSLKAT